MNKMFVVLLAFLSLLPLAAASSSCDRSCCTSAGGSWDYTDDACTEPDSFSEYFSCSMDCDDSDSGYGSYGSSSSSSCCCGPALVLLGVAGFALYKRK